MRYLIVCGGREFDDKELLEKTLQEYALAGGDFELIHGAHWEGADKLADDWWNRKMGKDGCISKRVFPADWKNYPKYAGPKRNTEMVEYVEYKRDGGDVIAFWNGKSRGTADTITKAQEAGLKVQIIYY